MNKAIYPFDKCEMIRGFRVRVRVRSSLLFIANVNDLERFSNQLFLTHFSRICLIKKRKTNQVILPIFPLFQISAFQLKMKI